MIDPLNDAQLQLLARMRVHADGTIITDPSGRRWKGCRFTDGKPTGMTMIALRTNLSRLRHLGFVRPIEGWVYGEVLLAPELSVIERAAGMDDVADAVATIERALKLPFADPATLMADARWKRFEQWARVSAIADWLAHRIKSDLIKKAPASTPMPMQTVKTND